MEINDFVGRLKEFEELEAFINKRVEERLKLKYVDKYQSEKIDLLCEALSKAQGKFPVIATNRDNNFSMFRQYADLDQMAHAVRAPLEENGLSVIFQEMLEDEKVILSTKLLHSSAQFIETRTRIVPSKNDIQTINSHMKAKKRNSFMNILNLTIQDDLDDDDGEKDMRQIRIEKAKATGINTRYKAKEESFKLINKTELEELQYILSNYPDLAENLLENLSIESFADMPKSKYRSSKEQALKIIQLREGRTGKKIVSDNDWLE